MKEKIDLGLGALKDETKKEAGFQEGDFNVVLKQDGDVAGENLEDVRRSLEEVAAVQSSEDVLSGVGEPDLIPDVSVNLPKKAGNVGIFGRLKKMGRLGLLVASLFGGEEALAQNTNKNAPSIPKVGVGAWPGQVNKRERPFAFEKQTSVFPKDSYATNYFPSNHFPAEHFNSSSGDGRGRYEGQNVPDYLRMSEADFIKFVFFSVLKKNNESPNNYNFEAILKHCLLLKKGEKPQFPHPKMPPGFMEELSRLDREREAFKNQVRDGGLRHNGGAGYSVGGGVGISSGGKASDQWRNPFKGGPETWGDPDRNKK